VLSASDGNGSSFDDKRWTTLGGGMLELLEDTGTQNRRVLVQASDPSSAGASALANHLVHPDSVLKSCDDGLGLMFWAQGRSAAICCDLVPNSIRFLFAVIGNCARDFTQNTE
jgi:hypothetical protein